ncbi:hypothetical protein CALVIDRAFT_565135 [Calocera viscosa TUFC12733]|uniref:P-loop containing nucleoside triphosphate hydrolase protein n=1 Tax=Calocera viscosa (strain TUFC12733) TaxID=1330018 RepID=A0A167KUM5_CALVF|nr:hypothetical protein CALVIDRAFT_565135 [Calocera viscosa TUFC12733]
MGDPDSMGDSDSVQIAKHSLSDISKTAFAEEKRKLLDVIDKIRDIGGNLIPQLPRIVVIGNQSAGKSSLIEAIARINVPRDIGTCTRCPSEIRLRSSDGKWKCSISLRIEYKDGEKLEDVDTIPFSKKIVDPSKVEVMIRRAQLAILSPSREFSLFLKGNLDKLASLRELPFSRNVICIEVSGSGLTDLTFVDLPVPRKGIISSVQDPADADLIELIKSMVREYLIGTSIILVAITMRDDIDNQAAILEARKADPDGTRTIGVLTKPDTLQEGEEEQWLPVVQNLKNSLRLGYYVTKQPSPAEIKDGITFDNVRQLEQTFFGSTEPWSRLPPTVCDCLGTPNFISSLSLLLTEAIKRALPGITEKITSNLQLVKEELVSMPDGPSNNPVGDMLQLCHRAYTQLEAYASGARGCISLLQQNKATFRNFKYDVRATAPIFVPWTAQEMGTASKTRVYSEPNFLLEGPVDKSDRQVMGLDKVRKSIASEMTRELPFSVPFSAKVSMMHIPVKEWPGLVGHCFDHVVPRVEKLCDDVLQKVFSQFEHRPVIGLIRELVKDTLSALRAKTREALDILLALEEYPNTQNDHYFTEVRSKLVAHYQEHRMQLKRKAPEPDDEDSEDSEDSDCSHEPPTKQPPTKAQKTEAGRSSDIQKALSYLRRLPEYSRIQEQDLGKMLPEDPYTQEIVVMAEARAYFQVAYKRIIDNVPHAIHRMFIHPLAKTLYDALISGLQLDTPEAAEKCDDYLQESTEVVLKRESLHSTKNRLEKAKAELRLIGL